MIDLTKRYHHFDFVRALAMLLGIPFHVSLAYSLIDHHWVVQHPNGHMIMDVFGYALRTFRMPLFFFMAGFFSHLVYLKHGRDHFLVGRLKRITLPLIIFSILLLPIIKCLWILGEKPDLLVTAVSNGNLELAINYIKVNFWAPATDETYRFPVNFAHLWFLLYLTVMSVLSHLIAKMINFSKFNVSPFIYMILFPLILSFLSLFTMEGTWVDTPFIWYPKLSLSIYYAVFYFWGWGCFLTNRQMTTLLASNKFGISLFAIAPLIAAGRIFMEIAYNDWLVSNVVVSHIWLSFSTVGLILLSLHLAIQLGSKENQFIRYFVDASYFLYLIHIPFVPLFQLLLWPSSLGWVPQFLLVNLLTFICIIPLYHYGVRGKMLERFLRGQYKVFK